MTNYFNDTPIETKDDDQFGILPFAQSLAKSICTIEKPVGTALAINGEWGSGKSSAANLILQELVSTPQKTQISEFKCWWYRGEEALALAFLQNLHSLLSENLKGKIKDIIPKLGRNLLQAGPVVGSAMALTPAGPLGAVTTASFKFAERFFPKGDTLEKTFQKLSDVLAADGHRYLIVIDDIDRLSPDEVMAIFRIVKSVGRLPNVMYLLIFDRDLAEKIVKEKYPSEGAHFLEKIIQASFEMPKPLQSDLNKATLSAIENICGTPPETQLKRIMNVFYDVVQPYITTPRHVVRFQNAISVTWPAIAGEISLADFIGLEAIRLYEPSLFKSIHLNKSLLCGDGAQQNHSNDDKFSIFLSNISDHKHSTVKAVLQRLFPSMEDVHYAGDFHSQWDAERRVCISAHFDTYFRLSLSDEKLPLMLINEIVERADNADYIQSIFRKAAKTTHRTETSMIPVIFDELTVHAEKIEKEKAEPFLRAIFEIHDDINLEIDHDKGFAGWTNTTLRYHWFIRRLTKRRFSLDEKTDLYINAIENASLGWLVDFTSSAVGDYRESEQITREEDRLVREDVLDDLKKRALSSIRSAAEDGRLLIHQDLIGIMYRWCDFCDNDPSEVKEWTGSLLDDKDALVLLAHAFTGESWSMGMGIAQLPDHVSTRSITSRISEKTEIIDHNLFIESLESLEQESLSDKEKKTVEDFLDAWYKKKSGQDE